MVIALTYQELKKEAARRLFDYRRAGGVIRRAAKRQGEGRPYRIKEAETSAEELIALRFWRRIINRALDSLQAEDPELHRFMIRYFAMKAPLNRRRSAVLRHMEIAEEFHVSDSTIYKWRMEIVQRVCLEAMRSGGVKLK